MTAKQFLEEKQAEHFSKFRVYADTNSKIAEWMGEFAEIKRYNSVNRVELIDSSGRVYVKYGNFQIKVQVQDDDKTLKIFISDGIY